MASIMSNINLKDFNNLCRTCMNNCDIKFSKDNVILNIFYKLTEIHFETNDELPQQICYKCFEKINEIHEFSFQCKRSHSELLKCLNNLKNKEINAELKLLEETNELLNTEEITIVEHELVLVKNEILDSECENEIDELKLEKVEKTVPVENIIPETSNDQNLSSEDDFSETNTSYEDAQDEEETNNSVNLNESSNSDDSYIEPAKKSKKTNEEQFKCNVCNKIFKSLKYFQKHKSLRTCERSYKCEHCLKLFDQLCHLKAHLRMHTGERPFQCNQCFKRYTHASYLKIHMRVHSGDRPYKCDQCDKMFSNSSNLKTHIRTHTGERPYKCKQCVKMFSNFFNLQTHMRTHTGERPFKCSKCSVSYSQRHNLIRHMVNHSSE